MRTIVSGIAALALAAASVAVAFAMPGDMMGGTTGMMPKCSATTGPVVWWVAGTKMYYTKGSPMYGKGHGMYACRATAVARGGHMGKAMAGGSMSHGMNGSNAHGTSGGSMSHDAMPMSTTAPGGMMNSPMPRSTGSMGTGSGSTITPAPSQPLGGASPPTGTNMGNSSGGQGNTGAPGAGGQTPNNPASTTNNATPQPRPT